MKTEKFTRRQALQATAVLGTTLLLPVTETTGKSLFAGKTPRSH